VRKAAVVAGRAPRLVGPAGPDGPRRLMNVSWRAAAGMTRLETVAAERVREV
jgi:hypothetical protein